MAPRNRPADTSLSSIDERHRPLRHAAKPPAATWTRSQGWSGRRRSRAIAAVAVTAAGGALVLATTASLPAGAATARPTPRASVLWVEPGSQAAVTVRTWTTTRPARTAELALLTAIANQSQGTWVTAGLSAGAARARVANASIAAAGAGQMPTFVLYALPHLDCRNAGIGTAAGYRAWINQVRLGLESRPAIVVIEPDSLAMLSCLPATQASERLALLRYAVTTLSADPLASVYLDAGHNGWQSSSTMASRLTSAGVAVARGFTLNVSNFGHTDVEVAYGRRISAKLAQPRPFIVDVSRNGLGPDTGPLAWCNPPGRALGQPPTTRAIDPQVDALLWVKPPGESDGVCRPGEPSAGRFWLDYALGLARRSPWANPAPLPTDPTSTPTPTPPTTPTGPTTPTPTTPTDPPAPTDIPTPPTPTG